MKEDQDKCDEMVEIGKALVKVGEILKPLDEESRSRILNALAALYDIDIHGIRR